MSQNLIDRIPEDNAGCKVYFFSDATPKESASDAIPLLAEYTRKGENRSNFLTKIFINFLSAL